MALEKADPQKEEHPDTLHYQLVVGRWDTGPGCSAHLPYVSVSLITLQHMAGP
jgi:hypothetical protein